MQRVYGEISLKTTAAEDVVTKIKEEEENLGLNAVPEKFYLRKLGIKVDAATEVLINGRKFSITENEPLEFGYDTIKVYSMVFNSETNALIRYMYFREDMRYQ